MSDAPPPAPAAHEHDDDHGHEHGHDHPSGLLGKLKELVAPHSHDAADSVDSELEASSRGTRALVISLAVLGVTALLQAVVVVFTGSVALLGDTLHNVADALTAVPLAIAFSVGRRIPTRRYTYGYGRAEDLAGIAIVAVILASSALAAYEAVRRLLDPRDVNHLGAVAAAGFLGFLGNEVVARYRIRVGREIGSAALVADGLHARTDGFTSLAVVVGAIGVALGFEQADPIVGLLITVAILFVLRDAARQVYRRLMDAVDESLVDDVERVLRATPGVRDTGQVRIRWIGHALRAECEVVVAPDLSLVDGHAIAVDAEHRLLHDVRRLTAAFIHADPEGTEHHELTAHHVGGR
ncbi:MAG: cation diffusion facilitator family transporter [Actinobacteria bacterium]|nr:cation diffusion facilitator family transporter [Actinomycetota bacterium]MCA1719957.1 cation diffusion facilitator family transporter [Actinomycetota bacterium]